MKTMTYCVGKQIIGIVFYLPIIYESLQYLEAINSIIYTMVVSIVNFTSSILPIYTTY